MERLIMNKINLHAFVIPVYKESPYLEDCIISLKSQTTQSNLIITTSTPTEQTKKIAKKYDIPYHIYNGNRQGIANDWNFSLSKTTAQYTTIAHQDDIYEPQFVENTLKKATQKERQNLLIFTDYYDLVNGSVRKKSLNSFVKKILLLPFLIKSSHKNKWIKKSILLFGDPICCPSVTFCKENLEKFIFSTNFKCALDWVAWLDLASMEGGFVFINKKLVKHRIHVASETTSMLQSGERKQEELIIFKKIWGLKIGGFISWMYSIGHKDNFV